MTDSLQPPAEHSHHRWHWIETEHGTMAASWFPPVDDLNLDGRWDISGHLKFATDAHVRKCWRYLAPAVPPDECI